MEIHMTIAGTKPRAVLLALTVLAVVATAGASSAIQGTIVHPGGGTTGSTTVDHIFFTVASAGVVNIDVMSWEWDKDNRVGGGLVDLNRDGEFAYLDTVIHVFRDDDELGADDLLASGDDMSGYQGPGLADKSLYTYDSYLSLNLAAGNYILAVGAWELSAAQAITGVNTAGTHLSTGLDQPSDHGDYTVVFAGNASVAGGAIGGDANMDGIVNDLDVASLALNWLRAGNWSQGDFNGDGMVNDLDVATLALNWLRTSPVSKPVPPVYSGPNSPAVPEPVTVLGVLGAVAGVGGYIRRRRTA